VHWLPLLVSLGTAALVTPPLLGLLERAGVVRESYRGLVLPTATGIVIPVAAMLALGPVAALDRLTGADVLRAGLGPALTYALGIAALGLVDDLLGGRAPAGAVPRFDAPRGWRGHARAVVTGGLSTGVLKACGALGLALYVLRGGDRSTAEYLLAVAVVVLSTNAFNLLDLRPGRAGKAFVALGAMLTIATWDTGPLQTLGLLVGPVLVVFPYDLRERAMLGDVGSNLLGAVAGLWLVLALSPAGQAVALAVLAAVTVYAEFRSITVLVEKSPLLRRLDSVGRRL
jgi:UDP-N-acetylmuramyl pentapeptide phosphotransferase/UDP-N-acetylglucosamine-1-phosphate transferase